MPGPDGSMAPRDFIEEEYQQQQKLPDDFIPPGVPEALEEEEREQLQEQLRESYEAALKAKAAAPLRMAQIGQKAKEAAEQLQQKPLSTGDLAEALRLVLPPLMKSVQAKAIRQDDLDLLESVADQYEESPADPIDLYVAARLRDLIARIDRRPM